MLSFAGGARIFVATGATDMRKSFDTLAQLARERVGEDPLGGALFVFCNRHRNRLKILWFDRGGFSAGMTKLQRDYTYVLERLKLWLRRVRQQSGAHPSRANRDRLRRSSRRRGS